MRAYVAIILALLVGLFVLWHDGRPPDDPIDAPMDPSAPVHESPPIAYVAPPRPSAPSSVEEERTTGGGGGIESFRPGTKPVKIGVVVPSGYELPTGYIAHSQTTDDGQALPPILMYHPDYTGNVPADRIVPADRVPAGMPVQMLTVPAPIESDE